jgi:uncharacterized protein YjbJ (UPF0337 family)
MSKQQLKKEDVSTVTGYKDKLVGGVKETVGNLLGMEKMEQEGHQQKQKGEAELRAAMAQQRALGDRSREQKGKGRMMGGDEGDLLKVDSYMFLKRQAVLSELERMGGFERDLLLSHHVETREPDLRRLFATQPFKLRRIDMKPLLNDIRERRTRRPLIHVETLEKGLMRSIKLQRNDFQLKRDERRLPNLWADIKRADNQRRLKKVNKKDINDRSSPRLDLFKRLKITHQQHNVLLREIAAPPRLRKVETKDKTKPNLFFDKNVHVHKIQIAPLLNEVRKGVNIKHVETKDRSKPIIERDLHLKKWDKQGFLAEVRQGTELKHV